MGRTMSSLNWKLILRDVGLICLITAWGGFAITVFNTFIASRLTVPPVFPLGHLGTLSGAVTLPIGFCIVGCLTHRFSHITVVALGVWLISFVNIFFGQDPVEIARSITWIFFMMLFSWGVSSVILRFPSLDN